MRLIIFHRFFIIYLKIFFYSAVLWSRADSLRSCPLSFWISDCILFTARICFKLFCCCCCCWNIHRSGVLTASAIWFLRGLFHAYPATIVLIIIVASIWWSSTWKQQNALDNYSGVSLVHARIRMAIWQLYLEVVIYAAVDETVNATESNEIGQKKRGCNYSLLIWKGGRPIPNKPQCL